MRVEADVNKSIALSFKNVHVSSFNPSKTIINDISGYVVKGGITAGNLSYIHFFLMNEYILIFISNIHIWPYMNIYIYKSSYVYIS